MRFPGTPRHGRSKSPPTDDSSSPTHGRDGRRPAAAWSRPGSGAGRRRSDRSGRPLPDPGQHLLLQLLGLMTQPWLRLEQGGLDLLPAVQVFWHFWPLVRVGRRQRGRWRILGIIEVYRGRLRGCGQFNDDGAVCGAVRSAVLVRLLLVHHSEPSLSLHDGPEPVLQRRAVKEQGHPSLQPRQEVLNGRRQQAAEGGKLEGCRFSEGTSLGGASPQPDTGCRYSF